MIAFDHYLKKYSLRKFTLKLDAFLHHTNVIFTDIYWNNTWLTAIELQVSSFIIIRNEGAAMLRLTKALALAFMMFLSLGSASSAEPMTWHIKSNYAGTVHLKFFNFKDSGTWVWPNKDKVFIVENSTRPFSINCTKGEDICYGAWAKEDSSMGWGVGYRGLYSCSNCCYRCGSGDVTLNLVVR